MNHRKLKKLFRDPKNFIFDSYIVNRVKKSMSAIDFKEKVSLKDIHETISINRCTTEAILPRKKFDFKSFINDLYTEVPCFYIEKLLIRNSICVEKKNVLSFFEKLCTMSYRDNLVISYNLLGKLVRPDSYSQLLNDLYGKKQVEFKIYDRRSQASVYFLLEVWNTVDNYILAPKANDISRKIFNDVITELYSKSLDGAPEISQILKCEYEDKVEFDIDYVFTWVNSEDPDWQELYSQYKPNINNDGSSLSRFKNREELKFSLRSLEKNAPWIRNIFIVSNCKPPVWLNMDHPKIQWVYHEEIFNHNSLPTFSSHAIESNLHKIKDLSNFFIYSNDDFFLARKTTKSDFFLSNGLAKIRFEPWGNVNGEVNIDSPDYLNAARNSNKLLERDFNKSTTQLHTHSPQSMNKSVLKELESKYTDEFNRTSMNKFRDISDIAVTGYLYHHYVYLVGKGVKDYTKTTLIQQNHDFKKIYKNLLSESKKVGGNLPLSFCVNDGADSHLNDEWNIKTLAFLENYFPDKSAFEK